MRRQGFTMAELLVAGAVGLIVITSALSFLVAVDRAHERRLRLAEMRRTSARVLDQLTSELRQAGVGIPSGSSLELVGAFASHRVVVGTANSVGFLVDIARPDGTLNGFSWLADDQVTDLPPAGVLLLNELNGDCDVSLGAVHCETGLATRLLPRAAGGCHVSASAPTCPWGLNRYRTGEVILVVDSAGRWVERTVGAGPSVDSISRRGLRLSAALPVSLGNRARGGFASTPDRVFYRLNAAALERQQCWDSIGTPTVAALGPCPTGAGTPWEPLAAMPLASTLTFAFFDSSGVALALPLTAARLPRVARVDVVLRLERQYGAEVLSVDGTQTVAFRQ